MNNINITQSTIHIIVNNGELNEKKFNIINESLGDYVLQAQGSDVIYNFKVAENQLLTLNDEGIKYLILGNDYNKEKCSDILSRVLDCLMADNNNFAVIDIQATSETEDAFKESREVYTEKFGSKIKNLKGVGYRFLIEGQNYNDDLKKEPLLANDKMYYHQLTRTYNKEKITLEEIIKSLDNIHTNIGEQINLI